MTDELAETLRNNDSQGFVDEALKTPGYAPLVSVAHQHASRGLTTIDEMLRLAGQLRDEVIDEIASAAEA